MAFTMQCNLEKSQLGQMEFLTENRKVIKATLVSSVLNCNASFSILVNNFCFLGDLLLTYWHTWANKWNDNSQSHDCSQ